MISDTGTKMSGIVVCLAVPVHKGLAALMALATTLATETRHDDHSAARGGGRGAYSKHRGRPKGENPMIW